MPAAYVQSDIGADNFTGDAAMVVAFTNNVVAGNLIVGAITWDGDFTLSGVTDSQGNTYTLETTLDNSTTSHLAVFYAIAGSSAACTVTATLSGNADRKAMSIHEASGVTSTTPRGQYAAQVQSNPGTGVNAVTSGSVTTATDGEYIFSAFGDPGFSTGKTAGTTEAYTRRENDAVIGILATEDVVQTSAGAIAGTWTTDGFTVSLTAIATFKAAAAAAPVIPSTPSPLPMRSPRRAVGYH